MESAMMNITRTIAARPALLGLWNDYVDRNCLTFPLDATRSYITWEVEVRRKPHLVGIDGRRQPLFHGLDVIAAGELILARHYGAVHANGYQPDKPNTIAALLHLTDPTFLPFSGPDGRLGPAWRSRKHWNAAAAWVGALGAEAEVPMLQAPE